MCFLEILKILEFLQGWGRGHYFPVCDYYQCIDNSAVSKI